MKKENNLVKRIYKMLTKRQKINFIILVFDNGKIVQKGKYMDLIKTPGIFQYMYNGKLK